MNQDPIIWTYIDEEERELIEAIENGAYDQSASLLNAERLSELQAMARNTMTDQRQKISLRVPRTDLARLKATAMREGIPYQSIINSLIHKHVSQWVETR